MATIKVPYTYTAYEFSPKATKLSKRMAKKKYETGIVTGMVSCIAFGAIVFNIPGVSDNTVLSFACFALCLVAAVFCGIYAEKYRNKLYKRMILKALEKDLNTAVSRGWRFCQRAAGQAGSRNQIKTGDRKQKPERLCDTQKKQQIGQLQKELTDLLFYTNS